jgi:hypothetical protein
MRSLRGLVLTFESRDEDVEEAAAEGNGTETPAAVAAAFAPPPLILYTPHTVSTLSWKSGLPK